MRLHKAHTEEKRLSGRFERREAFHGLGGHRAIGQFIVGFRADFIRRAFFARFAAFALRDVFERLRELARHAVKPRHRVLRPVLLIHADHFAARKPARLAPRRSVFKAMMLDLAQRGGVVAIRAEMLRQRHAIRLRIAEVRVEVPDLRRVGAQAGQNGRARRTAHRLGAVSAVENDAASREAVDVRRLRMLHAIAANVRPQVIDGDEEDVQRLRRESGEQRGKSEEEEKSGAWWCGGRTAGGVKDCRKKCGAVVPTASDESRGLNHTHFFFFTFSVMLAPTSVRQALSLARRRFASSLRDSARFFDSPGSFARS